MKILLSLIILLTLSLNADVGTLTKVVDGDTLYFNTNNKEVKCRIQYIDTPESYGSTKLTGDISKCRVSKKDMLSAGKSATRYAKSLLTIGNQYNYAVNGKGKYMRSICIVYLDGITFNEKMVNSGYATIYREYMSPSELKYFEDKLSTAKKKKVGLWKDRTEVIECLDKARK